ncbi:LytR/AlgR family response regulator transcription factor [Labilibacter marinus]|uniref:LytR/AlgR family response regulator transcription factor n=1 Tax=Labilibacter marinus TaxID=1477105 RepID=UPI00082BB372|nr:LytTR family DNA-binding domain-containing protein [Labilibacter marinus]
MNTYKTIIIDDEQPALIRLRELLSRYENIEIICEAENGIEAVKKINQYQPNLIFLDIKMPGLNGFEVLEKITHSPYVIFCTAYDEYALKAFETKSIDYLVKPVRPERLHKAMDKLNEMSDPSDKDELLAMVKQLMHSNKKEEATTLPIKTGDKIIFQKLSEVIYLQASEKYIEIHTRQGETHLMDQSLKNLEDKLPSYFMRIHRSYIINTNEIKEIQKYFSNRFVFKMEDVVQSKVISSKGYYTQIKAALIL